MPEQLIDSMQITARNLGALLDLTEEETRIILKETNAEPCIVIHTAIKNIVEKHDIQNLISFTQEDVNDQDAWTLVFDRLQTEKYHLLGILAAAYNTIVQPRLDKIQNCLQETLIKIKGETGINITAIPLYASQAKMFHISISVDKAEPFKLSHNDVDVLIRVAKAGIPNIIKKLSSGK